MYTSSACGVGSSSSPSSSQLVDIGLGAASEGRDEFPLSREQRERVNFRNAPETQLILHNDRATRATR
jgi:hypothetical protein